MGNQGSKSNRAGTGRLTAYLFRHKLLMTGTAACALSGNAASAAVPLMIAATIDAAASGGVSAIAGRAVIIGLLYVAGAVLVWLTAVLANIAGNRTVRELRQALFIKLGKLPVAYFDRHQRGDLQSRFTSDIDAISDGLSQGVVQLLSGVVTVVLSLVFMLSLSVRVTLVVALVTPLCFFAGFAITRYGSGRFREQSHIQGQLSGYTEEMISGQTAIAAFGYAGRACDKFAEMNGELYQSGYRAQFASALVNPATRFVNNIAYVSVGVVGVIMAANGSLTLGGVAGFLAYVVQFAKPFNEITAITMQLQLASAAAGRVFEALDADEQTTDDSKPELKRAANSVTFHDVCFSYTPSRPLIRHFSMTAPAGKTIAVVGPTGAGKTTLVNLLMRFYEIDSGGIFIGRTDITSVTRDSVRGLFGMVLQDTWLFAGTVRDNIAYGRRNATDAEVMAAAKAAHAHSFIKRMPGGYDAFISEDGNNLSRGQKQLLTIARVMLLDPPMLILDEATSSVDVLTEQRIQGAFRRLMNGRTAFVIAHRLSTIRDADHILVLERGNIAEQGTHDELLAQGGLYHRLYHTQFEPEKE